MAYSLKSSPGHLLRRAQQYAHDLYSKEVGSSGPTPRQFEVLHVVAQNEGLSQTDLVRHTGIDRSTLADMIARMMKKGLLSRKRTKEDARANAVSITAAGKRMLSGASSKVTKSDGAVLKVLPKTQQAAFMKALKAYAEALDKMEESASAPKKRATKRKAAKKTARKTTKRKTAKKKAPAKRKAKRRTKRR
ncbi:MAG: MarR family winged helix-turn-helix transcriptional regulator [Pseudomonadota bacterium]